MKNKILFTGSSGKVGKLIIPFLIGNGYEIEYYDILENNDIFDQSKLEKKMKNCYAVIHSAAIPHPDLKAYSDEDYWKLNFEGSVSVLEIAKKLKLKKFIFFSSGSVYGLWGGKCKPDKFPITENQNIPTLKNGQTFYGYTKIEFEKFLKKNRGSLDVSVLRIEGIDKGHTRLEWINGFNDLNSMCKTPSKPAFHFFTRLSPENCYQAVTKCLTSKHKFEIMNISNEYVHWSIDCQRWIKENYPRVKNYTKGNQSLYGIDKAKKIIGFKPYPIDDHFLHRDKIESYYYNQSYFGKIGKP